MPPKKAAKKKGGYQMPEQFKAGFVLKDLFKKPWCLGKPIGQGGFGLIYTAIRGESQMKNNDDAEYVVKIEPKENGPLFCETHFYTNCAKEEELKKFKALKNLKHLSMPKYISSGTCVYNEKDYRFLVMDRYTTDLQRILLKPGQNHRLESQAGVLCLMRQLLWSLEYIHQRGYAHGDIKGANLMLKTDQESYLVDYGLAYRFKRDNIHQKYEIKPDRRHNGTIEYTSRDAHEGAQISRRSDLEILGYCIIHWTCGTLPWVDLIKSPTRVQESKTKSMANVKEFLKNTLESVDNISIEFTKFIEFYLNYVNKLEFDTEPDYSMIHAKITETLAKLGHSKSAKENFYIFNAEPKTGSSSVKAKTSKSKPIEDDAEESIEEQEPIIKKRVVAAKAATSILTPKSKKRDKQSVKQTDPSSSSDSESDMSKSNVIESSSKKTRPMPRMFDDTIEEPVIKKSPLVKPKAKPAKKVSKLIQSPQVVVAPVSSPRGTPRRAAYKTSILVENEEPELDSESKKENGSYLTPRKGALHGAHLDNKELNKSTRKPILVKKKRNKNAKTISTQTESSYLQDIKNKVKL